MARPLDSVSAVVMVAAALIVGCGEPSGPALLPFMTGDFVLERVNGTALPVHVELTSGPCVVDHGFLELTADGTINWGAFCVLPPIAPQNVGSVAFGLPFRQVTTDSIDFPRSLSRVIPSTPHSFARFGAGVLTLRTTANTPNAGAHTWTFRPAP